MLISEAIANVKALTGAVVDDATLVRWLSEFDGKLALEFFHEDEFEPYDPVDDLTTELKIPFPWDGVYVHHLEAMTYYTNGEYDRSANARAMSEAALSDYRKHMQRTQCVLHTPCRRDCHAVYILSP